MARDPGERWSTAGELERAFKSVADRIITLDTRSASRPFSSRLRGSRLAARLAVLAAIAGISAAVATRRSPRPPPSPASRPVIAVLPLLTSQEDRIEQSIAGGLADALVSSLANMPSVTVVSRAAT